MNAIKKKRFGMNAIKKNRLISVVTHNSEFKCLELGQSLLQFWKEGIYCDVSLRTIDGVTFPVHKIVICSMSKYFHAMLGSNNWSEANKQIVQLGKEVNSKDLKLVLEYIYENDPVKFIIKLTWEIAFDVYHLANYLNIDPIENLMETYLVYNVSYDNCLILMEAALPLLKSNLILAAERYIKLNTKLFYENNLAKLTPEILLKILHLKSSFCGEQGKCYYALKWIKEDIENRQNYIKDVFDIIEFSKLSNYFIVNNILKDEIWSTNEYFFHIIVKAFNLKLQCRRRRNKLLPYFDWYRLQIFRN